MGYFDGGGASLPAVSKIGVDGTPDVNLAHGLTFNSDGSPNISANPNKMGGDIATGVQSWGAGLGGLNPLNNKVAKPNIPTPVGPPPIVAPTLTGGPVQLARPGSYTGGTINQVSGPSAAQIQLMGGDANAFRQSQLAAINGLTGIANGSQPGLAAQQVQQAQQANIASTYALANSGRGGFNPSLARSALETGATQNANMATQAAQAQLSERLQAAGLIGQIGGQGYTTDADIAKAQAGLTQQANIAGYQGGVTQAVAQGQLDQQTATTIYTAAAQAGVQQADLDSAWQGLQAQYAQMGMSAQQANTSAALQIQQLIQSGALGAAGIQQKAKAANNDLIGNTLGGLGKGVAGAAALGWKPFAGGTATTGSTATAGGDAADVGDIASTV